MYNYLFKGITPIPPASLFVALWIGDPTSLVTSGQEVAGGDYERVNTGTGDWSSATADVIGNVNPIVFPEATTEWANAETPITHVILYDVLTPLLYGQLEEPLIVYEGGLVRFEIGMLVIGLV
jgi:hypothetical protein